MTPMKQRLDTMMHRRSADDARQLTEKLRKDYCKKYGLRPLPPSLAPTCADSILQTRGWARVQHAEGYNCRGPHADHNSGFRDLQTGERVGVEQPYFGYPPATLEQITADVETFAAAHGLTVRVSADESWHCPGRTVLIEYRRAGRPELVSGHQHSGCSQKTECRDC